MNAHRRIDPVRLLLLGPLCPRHRMVRRRQGTAEAPGGGAPRHRARRLAHRRHGGVHRRTDRPLPPEDDGAAAHRLRAAHVGRRHPAPAFLGPRLRGAEGEGRGLPSERRPAGRLLGHVDRRGPVDSRRRRARGRPRAAREGHRPLERHRDLRRQGHGLPVLEVRHPGPGLRLPQVCHAHRWRRPVGHDQHAGTGGSHAPVVRRRDRHLQRHRRAAVVSPETAEAGAGGGGPSGRGRTPDALLVRDGGAFAQHRARAGLCAAARLGRSEEAVRRGVGPQGPGREGRRPDRSRDREGARRGGAPPAGSARRRSPQDRRVARHRGGALLPGEVLAHQGHRLRHRRGPQLRG